MNKFELFLTIFMFARAVIAVIDGLRNSPVKRLKAIRKAEEENCVTTAKISCSTLNGTYKHYTQQVEYVYKVNDELYFLTYELRYIALQYSHYDIYYIAVQYICQCFF